MFPGWGICPSSKCYMWSIWTTFWNWGTGIWPPKSGCWGYKLIGALLVLNMFWRVTESCLALGYLPLLMQPRGWPLSLSLRNSLESEGLSCSPLLLEVLWRANSQSECYWHRISWSRGKGEKRSISLLFQSYWMSPGWSFFAWEYEYLALIFNRTHTRCNIACNVTGVEASSTSATFHATIARSIARNVASCVRSFMH